MDVTVGRDARFLVRGRAHADAARILDRLRGVPAPRTTRPARMS
ncbi:hypothetical protein [Streptomyces mirabilis]